MPPTADSGSHRLFRKQAGTEPLPGYRLLEPLGRGGFGEVWKCEAPGGLLKAIKFVPGGKGEDGQGERRQAQELDAFREIKAIRHPFLLTLERVEVVAGDLVMVMELADRQLADRFRECRTCGLPGIPRDELLAYFADAAEALDVIAGKHGLQHLDVKPANLFLVAGHVKVGDYGLVAKLNPDADAAGHRGLTPKYVAPEALRGEPSDRSDQYSLALVYQELLTGTFPYAGKTAQQLMLQHVSSKPDLSGLPPVDQPIVAKALAKDPADRFGSCLGFVQALMAVATAASLPGAGMEVRRRRVERSMAEMDLPTGEPVDGADPTGRPPTELTADFTLAGTQGLTAPGRRGPLPKLVAAGRPSGAAPAPPPRTPAPISAYLEPAAPARRFAVHLSPIRSVVPVARLLGLDAPDPPLSAADFARAVVAHAAAGAHVPELPGDVGRAADGTWFCQFPSTVPLPVVPIKLSVVRDAWGLTADVPEPARVVLRKSAGGGGFWGGGKKSGFEVVVRLPAPGKVVGEVTVTGGVYGAPDREFARQAQDLVPKLIGEVRQALRNVEDRRKYPRVAAGFGATLYPIHGDGGIDATVLARVRDVSLGGLCVATDAPLPTKYVFAAFEGAGFTAGYAVLVRLIRTQAANRECLSGGQYRVDL
ncbi:MAG: hypothetical protein C0501_13520 [Isosphaera sp.]|nr:hypothetical protein [Isosphaera sp.]